MPDLTQLYYHDPNLRHGSTHAAGATVTVAAAPAPAREDTAADKSNDAPADDKSK